MKSLYSRIFGVSIVTLALTVGCGDSDSDEKSEDENETSDSALQLETLPNLTGKLAAYASTDESTNAEEAGDFDNLSIDDTGLIADAEGIVFGDGEDIAKNFSEGTGSYGACESLNQTLKFFHEASRADFWQCLVRQLSVPDSVDLYDGADHVLQMNITTDGQTFEAKVKMKITGTEKNITGLTTHICLNDSQIQYIDFGLTDGTFDISATLSNDGDLSSINVSGALDDDGAQVGLRELDYKTSSDDNFKEAKITMSSENIFYNGYQKSTSGGDASQQYFFVKLIDPNSATDDYSLNVLQFGSGAAYLDIQESSFNNTVGWQLDSDADTAVADDDSDFLTKVTNKSDDLLDVASSAPSISFSDAAEWDCSGDAEAEIDVGSSEFSGCDERYEVYQESLDCSSNTTP